MDFSKTIFAIAVFAYIIALSAFAAFKMALEPFDLLNPLFSSVALAVAVFLLSMLSFGKFSPIVLAIAGMMQSQGFFSNPITALQIIPTMIAAYAGISLGQALEKELKENNSKELDLKRKKIIAMLALAIFLAAAIEIGMPAIKEIVESIGSGIQGFTGGNAKPINISGILGDLAN